MTNENKLKGIAQWLDNIVKETDDLGKNPRLDECLSKTEVSRLQGERTLALELLIRFHLEENLD